MRHGTVLSLRGTASGLLFAAHLAPKALRAALLAEGGGSRVDDALAARLAHVRAQGVSIVVDGALPGVSAVAAPVFDENGAVALCLTAIGPNALVDVSADGVVARTLRADAAALSRTLGARGDQMSMSSSSR
jgi:DNA-binding IclR family transcriptional regulator